MPKEIKYDSVAQRFITERDAKEVIAILIMILGKMFPNFFEDGVNEVVPRADGEPHSASYIKPQ